MAYTTINDPSAYFQTVLYTGNGGTLSVTNSGNSDLQPDFVWIKNRDVTSNNNLYDSVRGVQEPLYSNLSNEESTVSTGLTAFNTDGFSVGSNADHNGNNQSHLAWQWKAGTSVSGTTTGGTGKAYSGSVNTDAGISIITYLGNDNSAHVIPHHLGVAPELTIIKERSNADIWVVQNSHLGFGNYMTLQTTNASASTGGNFITSVSSSAVTMNENAVNNANDESYILYSFASKQGYSKVGSYIANSNSSNFIYTGFKPAFLIVKQTEASGNVNWGMFDNKRPGFNSQNGFLYANTDGAEDTSNATSIDLLSNGFQLRANTVGSNPGKSYIYMCFAESPFVTSTGVPATAR